MQLSSLPPTSDTLTPFEAQALLLEDPRPYPQEEALLQLGHGLVNEVLDLVLETPLEDFSGLICEAMIGAFHSAAQRVERDADKARDGLNGLLRDFDGSEILDVEIARRGGLAPQHHECLPWSAGLVALRHDGGAALDGTGERPRRSGDVALVATAPLHRGHLVLALSVAVGLADAASPAGPSADVTVGA